MEYNKLFLKKSLMLRRQAALITSNNPIRKYYFAKYVLASIFGLLSLIFIFNPAKAFAAEFSLDSQSKEISAGQEFKVDFNINTEKESINSVEGKIDFTADSLELSEIRTGDSIVNFWIDKPEYKNGGIIFSGITPGGYVLDKGLIFSIIFKAKKEGTALIGMENVAALENDGKGTESKVTSSALRIDIFGAGQSQEENLQIVDKEAPDLFKPEVSRDPNLFDNKWFVAFVAQDKGSGIAKYEVKESRYAIFSALGGPASGWGFSKWVETNSPYVLTDQELKSFIFIKAIDNAGNERIVKLPPQNPIPWYADFENWFIIVLAIIVAFIYFLLRKKFLKV